MVYADSKNLTTIFAVLKSNVGTHIREPTKEESAHLAYLKQTEEQTYKKAIVCVISSLLAQLVAKNDQKVTAQNRTLFDSKHGVPPVSIQSYLERIIQYAPCSPECFFVCLMYIDRVISSTNFLVTSLNIHRLLITSIMLASKLFDDTVYNNKHFSIVGGIEVGELNILELAFLHMLGFRLVVDGDKFLRYQTLVEKLYAVNYLENSEANSANYEAIATSPTTPRRKALFDTLQRSKSCVSIGFSNKPRPEKEKPAAVTNVKVSNLHRSLSFFSAEAS
jgi:hypothetical protein